MGQECMGYKFHDLSQLILPMFQMKTKSREVTYCKTEFTHRKGC